MDSNTTFFVGFLVALLIIFLGSLLFTKPKRQKVTISGLEELSKIIDSENTAHTLGHVGAAISELREQVDHLAKVQMLILTDMGKEHAVQPRQDVLVKATKERSA